MPTRTALSIFVWTLFLAGVLLSPAQSRAEDDAGSSALRIPPEEAIFAAVTDLERHSGGFELNAGTYRAAFATDSVEINAGADLSWRWRYAGICEARGTGSELCVGRSGLPQRTGDGPRVNYDRGVVQELYIPSLRSLEQQFIITKRPHRGEADLIVRGSIESTGTYAEERGAHFWRSGSRAISYGKLKVFDANGATIPASIEISAANVGIRVDGPALAKAVYPVTIDPEIGSDDFRISDMGPDGNTTFEAVSPTVAYNSTNNEYLVVWVADDNTGALVDEDDEIYGQRINAATGAEVGTNDFRISDMGTEGNTDFDALSVDVVYNSTNNEYLVVWGGDDTTNAEFEIFGQRLAGASGVEVGTNDFRISDMGNDANASFQAINPAVTYNSTNNEYLVVWQGDDNIGTLVDGEFEIFGQRLAGGTGLEVGSNDFRISDMGPDGSTTFGPTFPSLTYNSTNNEYLVVWESDDNTGSLVDGEFEIFGQRLAGATGLEVGSNDFRISDMGPDGDLTFDASGAKVAHNSTNNEYLVVWSGDDNTGALVQSEKEVYAQRLAGATGLEVGTNDSRISTMGTDGTIQIGTRFPAVAYNAIDNEYLVSWTGGIIVSGEEQTFGQLLAGATALEIGSNDFQLSDLGPSDSTSFDAFLPDMAFNSTNNSFLVVFQGDDNTGTLVDNESEIFGQLFGDASDLSLTKADSPDPVIGGGTLTYTIGVTNVGPDTARNVTVVDTLPSQVSFVSAAGDGWSCSENAGTVTCSRPTLAAGAAPFITVVTTATSGGTLGNMATVLSDIFDGTSSNNSDTEDTTAVTPTPTVTPIVTSTPTPTITPTPTPLPDPGTRTEVKDAFGEILDLLGQLPIKRSAPSRSAIESSIEELLSGITRVLNADFLSKKQRAQIKSARKAVRKALKKSGKEFKALRRSAVIAIRQTNKLL